MQRLGFAETTAAAAASAAAALERKLSAQAATAAKPNGPIASTAASAAAGGSGAEGGEQQFASISGPLSVTIVQPPPAAKKQQQHQREKEQQQQHVAFTSASQAPVPAFIVHSGTGKHFAIEPNNLGNMCGYNTLAAVTHRAVHAFGIDDPVWSRPADAAKRGVDKLGDVLKHQFPFGQLHEFNDLFRAAFDKVVFAKAPKRDDPVKLGALIALAGQPPADVRATIAVLLHSPGRQHLAAATFNSQHFRWAVSDRSGGVGEFVSHGSAPPRLASDSDLLGDYTNLTYVVLRAPVGAQEWGQCGCCGVARDHPGRERFGSIFCAGCRRWIHGNCHGFISRDYTLSDLAPAVRSAYRCSACDKSTAKQRRERRTGRGKLGASAASEPTTTPTVSITASPSAPSPAAMTSPAQPPAPAAAARDAESVYFQNPSSAPPHAPAPAMDGEIFRPASGQPSAAGGNAAGARSAQGTTLEREF
jgi:hypothetical protein